MSNIFEPAGPQAATIASLMWVFIGVCAAVYLATLLAFGWAIVRTPREDDDSDVRRRRLTGVVAGATALTALVLVVFTFASEVTGRGLSGRSTALSISVEAVGYQWFWDFRYSPSMSSQTVSSPNELHVPVAIPVRITGTSRDVIHSFWVPELSGKRDLIPGRSTETWIQADQPGVYRGQCAEFCGHQHARMAFTVVAEPMEAFHAWLSRQRQPAAPPSPATQRGHDVFMSRTCVTCHSIRGTLAGSRVGPDLTHVGSRRTIAAGTLANTREELRRWIRDPQSIKPGTRMPATPLSDGDLDAVVDFLRELR